MGVTGIKYKTPKQDKMANRYEKYNKIRLQISIKLIIPVWHVILLQVYTKEVMNHYSASHYKANKMTRLRHVEIYTSVKWQELCIY